MNALSGVFQGLLPARKHVKVTAGSKLKAAAK